MPPTRKSVEAPAPQRRHAPAPPSPGSGPETLFITRCASCTTLCAPLARVCSMCQGHDLTRVPSAGAGAIVSWKAAPRRASDRRDGDAAPDVTAIVELDEGPRVYTWIEGAIPQEPTTPVRVEFRPTPRSDRFPMFAVSSH